MALAPRSEANQIASLGLNSTSGNNGLNRRNPLTGGPIQAFLCVLPEPLRRPAPEPRWRSSHGGVVLVGADAAHEAQGAEYGKTYRYAAHRALEGSSARRRASNNPGGAEQGRSVESWCKPRDSQVDARGAVEARYASMA